METVSGGPGWVIVVNLILWTGLFLYMLRLHAKVRRLERTAPPAEGATVLPPQERIEP
ncbi:MAG TPA: CcmD family protein [Thermoanaerobaculia bacterium]|nr:CcmD family protein [Thermoanaerobaculia bacterium]